MYNSPSSTVGAKLFFHQMTWTKDGTVKAFQQEFTHTRSAIRFPALLDKERNSEVLLWCVKSLLPSNSPTDPQFTLKNSPELEAVEAMADENNGRKHK